MKQVKISDPHYKMLVDLARKKRLKPEDFCEEIIQIEYNRRK